jgi:flagellin
MSALVVNFNTEAANSLLNLDTTDQALSSAIAVLSSGKLVNSAQDNPAAYVISQFLQFQSTGTTQSINNTQTGEAVLNVAAGGISQINGLLDQMEQLATSSANSGAMDSSTLNANATQYSALQAQITAIVGETQFGLQPLLGGTYSSESFQVGAFTFNVITLSISAMTVGGNENLGAGLGILGTSVSNATAASLAIASIQFALSYLGSVEAAVGATQQTLTALSNNLTTANTNLQSANSTITDANMAEEMTTFTTDQVLLQSGLAMLGQAQANPTLVLKLL